MGGRPVVRRALASLLGQEGYEACEVASATEALRLLPDFVPDAVVCDASLGDALTQVLRAVRQKNSEARALVTRDGPAEASDAGGLADAFFDRPVNLFELRRALER